MAIRGKTAVAGTTTSSRAPGGDYDVRGKGLWVRQYARERFEVLSGIYPPFTVMAVDEDEALQRAFEMLEDKV